MSSHGLVSPFLVPFPGVLPTCDTGFYKMTKNNQHSIDAARKRKLRPFQPTGRPTAMMAVHLHNIMDSKEHYSIYL